MWSSGLKRGVRGLLVLEAVMRIAGMLPSGEYKGTAAFFNCHEGSVDVELLCLSAIMLM
jgi:hypothetical protein